MKHFICHPRARYLLPLLMLICFVPGQANGQTQPDRMIEFAGRQWFVKNTDFLRGPGPSFFSNSQESVWVDDQGHLHLKLRIIDDVWHSAQVTLPDSLGYGTYQFQIASNPDLFNPNVVFGLFVYEDDFNEIDIEFSRFSDRPSEPGQFVVQPGDRAGNKQKFPLAAIDGADDPSTHQFNWQPNEISFESYLGNSPTLLSPDDLISQWVYTGDDIPLASGLGTPRINLWQFKNRPPSDGQEVEVVITNFTFTPTAVPEPITATLGPMGLGVLGQTTRRRVV